jgi:hypothetical protein
MWNRSFIILVEPEPQRDAAPASTALAPNLIFNRGTGRLLKMSQTVPVSVFLLIPFDFITFYIGEKSEEIILTLFFNFFCFKKLAWCRVRAVAAF